MQPLYPIPSGMQPSVQPGPDSPATAGHTHLFRSVATHLSPPVAVYFKQDYPPPAMCYHQSLLCARPINPVAHVRPALYPPPLRIPVNSTTEMEAVIPAYSPNPLLWETAAFGQTDTNKETDVTRIAKPLNTGWAGEADSTQSTTAKTYKKVSDPGKKTRTRVRYTPAQLHVLRKQFGQTPFISREEADRLASNLEIKTNSVINWFTNERRRVRAGHSSSAKSWFQFHKSQQ